ncbi:MAG: transcriptional repressor [Candidatus Woesearchaeota archaeon]
MKPRNTVQKLKILSYLNSVKTHPTAEQIYKAIAKEMPAISLATVYRNLNSMAEQGTILRLEIGKEYRYDAKNCGHCHLVCDICGRIIDIEDKAICCQALKKISKTAKGFCIKSINLSFSGICSQCKSRNAGKK